MSSLTFHNLNNKKVPANFNSNFNIEISLVGCVEYIILFNRN